MRGGWGGSSVQQAGEEGGGDRIVVVVGVEVLTNFVTLFYQFCHPFYQFFYPFKPIFYPFKLIFYLFFTQVVGGLEQQQRQQPDLLRDRPPSLAPTQRLAFACFWYWPALVRQYLETHTPGIGRNLILFCLIGSLIYCSLALLVLTMTCYCSKNVSKTMTG